MKKHYLPFLILILIATTLLLASCGESYTYYTVNFDLNGGTAKEPMYSISLEKGQLIVEPAEPTRDGYNFRGWYIGDKKWNFDTDTVTQNATLKAKWERITHTVTFDSAGGSAVEPATVGLGDRLNEPPTPEKADSELIGWYLGDVEWNFATDTVTEDITLVAKWDTKIKVSFVTESHCVRPTQIHEPGEKVEKPHNPSREGYRFLGWYCDDEPWNFETELTASITLVAAWEECETYKITFDSFGGTPVETVYVPVGEKIEKPPSPTKKSCELLWWEFWHPVTDELTFWDFSTMVPDGDMELIAYWSLPIHRP